MDQGSLLLWEHRYCLPQLAVLVGKVTFVLSAAFLPILAEDYQTPNPVYHVLFEKEKIAVSMYLTLLTSEMRLLVRLVTDLPGTIIC